MVLFEKDLLWKYRNSINVNFDLIIQNAKAELQAFNNASTSQGWVGWVGQEQDRCAGQHKYILK